MSVTAVREIIDNRGASQKFGENVKVKRAFMVTVDDATTPVTDISDACGIGWLDQHPDFSAVVCTDISTANDGDPLHYKVEFNYDILRPEDKEAGPTAMPWQRPDKFSFNGALTSVPAIVHYNNGLSSPQLIVNSAGDPLEGATRDQAEWRIQINGARQAFPKSLAMNYINAVNSDSWSGFPAKTLKVQGLSGQREVEQINNTEVAYWSISVDIAYRPEGWELKLWDVGYNEIVGGQRQKILDKLREPVSDPVALSGGSAKSAGSPPDMLTFKIYREASFAGIFPTLPS
jgi:hypothetical protein